METDAIVAGSGGQGIQFICKLLVAAAMSEGKYGIYNADYSAETRGGPSYGVVRILDKFGCPIIDEADYLIALDNRGLEKQLSKVKSGGLVICNRNLVHKPITRTDVRVLNINASDMAKEIGNEIFTNVVMLGGFIAASYALNISSIEELIKHELQEKEVKKPGLIGSNLRALHAGYRFVAESVFVLLPC